MFDVLYYLLGKKAGIKAGIKECEEENKPYIQNAYAKCEEKGAEMPENQNIQNLADCIDSIYMPYKKINYIKSTGTQYIDTEYKHNQNTRFVAKLGIDSYSNWSCFFGSFGGTNSYPRKLFSVETTDTGKFASYYGFSYETFDVNALGIHEFDFNKNIHTIDDDTNTLTAQSFQSLYNDLIFGVTNYSGEVAISPNSIKLYYFKIYENDTLIRDFIPVLNNNEPCLLDLVSGHFFYNKGTGTFLYN